MIRLVAVSVNSDTARKKQTWPRGYENTNQNKQGLHEECSVHSLPGTQNEGTKDWMV